MSSGRQPLYTMILGLLRKPLPEKINAVHTAFCRLKSVLYYRHVFAGFGSGSVLYKPMMLSNPRFIHIGRNVTIRQGVRLEAILSDPANPPKLSIGDNVNIEQNVHIVCHSRVTIGNDVSITGHCAIVDVTHPYNDVHDPTRIGDRILAERSFVEIGERSFLGFNAIIMPNVCIGRYCIVGAHSVVTRDVPDYCVVAGNPARVQRRFDAARNEWTSTGC